MASLYIRDYDEAFYAWKAVEAVADNAEDAELREQTAALRRVALRMEKLVNKLEKQEQRLAKEFPPFLNDPNAPGGRNG